jgi:hypothetical protein
MILKLPGIGCIVQVVVGEFVNGEVRLTAMAATGDEPSATKLLEAATKLIKPGKMTKKLAA